MDFSDSVHLNKINTFFNVYSSAYDVDDPEASTNFICTLTVSDGQLSDTSSLHITLNNINDNSPTFDTPVYDFSTVADVSLNTVIGSVTATDGDVGEFGNIKIKPYFIFQNLHFLRGYFQLSILNMIILHKLIVLCRNVCISGGSVSLGISLLWNL